MCIKFHAILDVHYVIVLRKSVGYFRTETLMSSNGPVKIAHEKLEKKLVIENPSGITFNWHNCLDNQLSDVSKLFTIFDV